MHLISKYNYRHNNEPFRHPRITEYYKCLFRSVHDYFHFTMILFKHARLTFGVHCCTLPPEELQHAHVKLT